MRSLIFGVLLFLVWSALSIWYYSHYLFQDDTGPDLITQTDVLARMEQTMLAEHQKAIPPEEFIIYFDFNQSAFQPDEKLAEFIEECKNYLQAEPASCLLITGHTDAMGNAEYNNKLGKLRAGNLEAYFITMGLSENCIRTESKGEAEPVADNSTENGRALNRRAVLIINP